MRLASNIKGVGTSDEQAWVFSLDFPCGIEAKSLLRPVLDWYNEVVLLLSKDSLSNLTFLLRLSCNTVEVVQ